MKHLHQICASTTPLDRGVEQTNIDIFDLDGCYTALFAELAEVQRVLATTDCNLLRLSVDDERRETLVLIAGWPHPWRGARLSLNEVSTDEEINLFLRVAPPQGDGEAAWERAEELPWIRVEGSVKTACRPIEASVPKRGGGEIRARDLALPRGLKLAGPPDQILYRRPEVAVA